MTIFTKAKIIKILQNKVDSGEIKSFLYKESYIRLIKSKRTGFTFKFDEYSDSILISILKKKTPEPSVQNIEDFYKRELNKFII
jgi:hypothetical protein